MREMKDSGIEWIGELPIGWEIRKIKHVATLNGRIGWQGLTSSEYCDDGAYLITGINFDNGQIDWSTCVHVPMERWVEAPQIQIQNGDLLITKDGTVGKVAIVSNMPSETSLNSGVLLIRTVDSCYQKYLFWILQSEIFWKWFNAINAGNSTIIHLYQYDFCNFSFPFPEYSLQCNIANYLDRKCSQIDAIIDRQQEVIEKLKAYKLSVITEAVTKGLNPNVPMKDSGVEWIGEIPEHWSIVPLTKQLESIVDYRGKTPEKVDDGIFLVTARNIKNGMIDYSISSEYVKAEDYDEIMRRGIPQIGDVLFTTEAPLGQVANVDRTDIALAQRIIKFSTKKHLDSYFLKYWIMSVGFQNFLMTLSTGSTAVGIKASKLFMLPVLLAPMQEQKQIVTYLDKKCERIESVIDRKQAFIDKFTAYKKSLIYEVVTGKKEV